MWEEEFGTRRQSLAFFTPLAIVSVLHDAASPEEVTYSKPLPSSRASPFNSNMLSLDRRSR